MANINSGAWVRFDNDAIIMIGSDTLKNYVSGSFRYRRRTRERIPNIDRGVQGLVTVGDERPQEIEFEIYRTSITEATLSALMPAATSGVETYVTLVVKIPNYQGATTGYSYTFDKFYLPDGVEDQANQGASADKITIRGVHAGTMPTPTSY